MALCIFSTFIRYGIFWFATTNVFSFAGAQNFPPFSGFEPTIDGGVSYYALVNQIQQWHRSNPGACGQDTSTCGVQQLVNNFESCAAQSRAEHLSDRRKDPRIINGCPLSTHATVGWSVAVLLNTTLCGGTLVSPQHIVLAAHCLLLGVGANSHPPYRSIGVIVGATDLHFREPGARLYALESFARHPNFNSEVFANDTAILKLAQPVPFNGNNGVRPACLADHSTTVSNKDCVLAGYGITSFLRNDSGSGYLRYSVLAVHDLKECLALAETIDDGPPPGSSKDSSSPFGGSTPWLFCAAGKRMKHASDSCHGDSGSGVMCKSPEGRWTLQGIVSFGPERCAQIPGFYADAFNLGIRNPPKLNAFPTSSATTVVDRCSSTKFKPATSLFGPPSQPSKHRSPFDRPTKLALHQQFETTKIRDAVKTVDLLADVDDATMRPVKNQTLANGSVDLLGTVLSDKS